MLDKTAPREIHRLAVRTFATSAPACVLIPAAWTVGVLPAERPYLVLMVYLASLATALGAGMVAALAACHIGVATAFNAGVRCGQVPGAPQGERGLRLVE